MQRSFIKSALLAALALGLSTSAHAVPLLQLDIQDGYYDFTTRTIIASANPFTLYAIATPEGTTQGARYTLNRVLSETYYFAAAVSPQVAEPGADLGFFTVNGNVVRVTADMIHGKPPIEQFGELQDFDRGDLPNHEGLYPTFFKEFSFDFRDAAKIDTYDTANRAASGGPGPTLNDDGKSLMKSFVIDTSGLNTNFVMHFDLYNEALKKCGSSEQMMVNDPSCKDVDVNQYAPFGYDAQSPPVPEPATMVLFGTGIVAGAYRRYRNRRAQQSQQQ